MAVSRGLTVRATKDVRALRKNVGMMFEIFKAFPPDRETAVAAFNARHDGVVDVPAEVYGSDGQLRIAISDATAGWHGSIR